MLVLCTTYSNVYLTYIYGYRHGNVLAAIAWVACISISFLTADCKCFPRSVLDDEKGFAIEL